MYVILSYVAISFCQYVCKYICRLHRIIDVNRFNVFTLPPVGKGSIVISTSASLSVCLSVCLPACESQKPHVQISPNFLYMLPVAQARSSSDGSAMSYVLPVFVDDVMFLHNGPNRPESQTMCMFRGIRLLAAQVARSRLHRWWYRGRNLPFTSASCYLCPVLTFLLFFKSHQRY